MKSRPFYFLLASETIFILSGGTTSLAVLIWVYQIDERATTLRCGAFFVNRTC